MQICIFIRVSSLSGVHSFFLFSLLCNMYIISLKWKNYCAIASRFFGASRITFSFVEQAHIQNICDGHLSLYYSNCSLPFDFCVRKFQWARDGEDEKKIPRIFFTFNYTVWMNNQNSGMENTPFPTILSRRILRRAYCVPSVYWWYGAATSCIGIATIKVETWDWQIKWKWKIWMRHSCVINLIIILLWFNHIIFIILSVPIQITA